MAILFKRRKMRPGIIRYLHRVLENPATEFTQKECISKALDDQTKIDKITNYSYGLAKKSGELAGLEAALENQGAFEGLDDPFLDALFQFLKDHWSEILLFIMKLFGM